MKIVLASNNTGKITEFINAFGNQNIEIIPQGQLNVSEIAEPHTTFVENAILKARHACKLTGLPAIADDSGLCVDALGGAPGVYSARYSQLAGEEKSDHANNLKLIKALQNTENRQAKFVAVLVYMRSESDPVPIISTGVWSGEILTRQVGSQGFGYDPVFYVPDLNLTAAQMSVKEKNTYSHRAQALKGLVAQLQNEYKLVL